MGLANRVDACRDEGLLLAGKRGWQGRGAEAVVVGGGDGRGGGVVLTCWQDGSIYGVGLSGVSLGAGFHSFFRLQKGLLGCQSLYAVTVCDQPHSPCGSKTRYVLHTAVQESPTGSCRFHSPRTG